MAKVVQLVDSQPEGVLVRLDDGRTAHWPHGHETDCTVGAEFPEPFPEFPEPTPRSADPISDEPKKGKKK